MELLSSAFTVAAFCAFLAVVWWAYAPSRKAEWERKGLLDEERKAVLEDDAEVRQ